ncbi:3-oxoacyl-[acyl-carrier-protein] synthase III C-terminal domain-containing protein [Bacillus sp. 31A1R]|uniref:3-oxoacyl-[acyl-carrier-protein] synthase III C-terminal domain-containing protein n=1 Tax=Robertmurraya mangrovi TaxID=3098077 RepID=A0ABU5J1F0_9BACI|nr:3-oxoacyl-[acyl-carrier-protein] synthase III C-terminal domain-containing protein [Bacillus sp. 31A1R]MDZ5473191.1 3-oxoacyl-[acyl-carrier-protein] synthase III C-terminal domain-containing protein [Bacillus sp. 31A1R]
MPSILSVAEAIPSYQINQDEVLNFSRELFSDSFKDIERLLKAFQNGEIEKRHFAKDIEWFSSDKTFEEKNNAYIENAVELGSKAIVNCLHSSKFLKEKVDFTEIDAIITISSTGLATPSIEARIMNLLSFSEHTKRIPIWGLGCAGGASGLSRAYEYCLASPKAKVLVLTIELCSLTFQRNDHSKSNLIGTSLFADGVACALVVGDDVERKEIQKMDSIPSIFATQSTTMKHSLDVMGWDVKNEGLYVIFSKDIPSIIEKWLKPNVYQLLNQYDIEMKDIEHFVAHPGGKKVLQAYVHSLDLTGEKIEVSQAVLREYGNMSSSTILYVLRRFMEKAEKGELGLATALGPGFSSELLLLRWV